MYISSITLKNFRIFDSSPTEIKFKPGLTLLVGENDSGKSAIIDALKIVLGTTDLNWYRIQGSDFYNEDITKEIAITCKFSNLSVSECAAFLEYLSFEKDTKYNDVPVLYLNWTCKFLQNMNPPRPIKNTTTGVYGNGPTLVPEARELLRVTHLKALRDAYSDMQSGRNSRLSRVIQNLSNVNEGKDEYESGDQLESLSILGILNLSNQLLTEYKPLKDASSQMTDILAQQMLLKGDSIVTSFGVSGANASDSRKIVSLLEKLDLTIDQDNSTIVGLPGLGTSNIMSMACELLLKRNAQESSEFLLIEEPEAHIHAQRQLKLVRSLQKEAEETNQQIIMTTHSPLLASVVKLSNLIIIKRGKAFPLDEDSTKLSTEDYLFLEKYLDATKANLFFARSVMIVEGPGEALLIPTLAKLLNRDFTDYGVSLVDVRSTGLRRYSNIFQRKDGDSDLLDINVGCIADRDVMPNCAPRIVLDGNFLDEGENWPEKVKRNWRAEKDFETDQQRSNYLEEISKRADGQSVKTFISNHWTLEYDLMFYGLDNEKMKDILIEALIKSSYIEKNRQPKKGEFMRNFDSFLSKEEKASYFYQYFSSKRTSKADFAQQLAVELDLKYSNSPFDLEAALPLYIKNAIYYVTEGDDGSL